MHPRNWVSLWSFCLCLTEVRIWKYTVAFFLVKVVLIAEIWHQFWSNYNISPTQISLKWDFPYWTTIWGEVVWGRYNLTSSWYDSFSVEPCHVVSPTTSQIHPSKNPPPRGFGTLRENSGPVTRIPKIKVTNGLSADKELRCSFSQNGESQGLIRIMRLSIWLFLWNPSCQGVLMLEVNHEFHPVIKGIVWKKSEVQYSGRDGTESVHMRQYFPLGSYRLGHILHPWTYPSVIVVSSFLVIDIWYASRSVTKMPRFRVWNHSIQTRDITVWKNTCPKTAPRRIHTSQFWLPYRCSGLKEDGKHLSSTLFSTRDHTNKKKTVRKSQ